MNKTTALRQRGISFFGLLIVGVLLALAGIVAARVVPTVTEYMAVKKTVTRVATNSDVNTSVLEIQRNFDLAAAADYITSVRGTDLKITKNNGRVVIGFAYNKELPLVGPAYLLLKYEGSSEAVGR